MIEAPEDEILFSAVLRPHRSASRGAICLVIGAVATIWLLVGIVFVALGAWPVFGFLGCEVVLLYVALMANLYRGSVLETVDISERALTIRRFGYWGREEIWSLPPYWMQVIVDERPGRGGRLELRSHGRSVSIGAFLTAGERRELAHALRLELAGLNGRWRVGAAKLPQA